MNITIVYIHYHVVNQFCSDLHTTGSECPSPEIIGHRKCYVRNFSVYGAIGRDPGLNVPVFD